jgi:hypothetical protein
MAEMLSETLARAVPLTEMIEELRVQLQASANASRGKGLRFAVDKVELELQVAVGEASEGGGGLTFWVLDASGKRAVSEQLTHTFKLTLRPVGPGAPDDGGGDDSPLLVADETSERPE